MKGFLAKMLFFLILCGALVGVFFVLKETTSSKEFNSPQWDSIQKKFFNPWQKQISFIQFSKVWKFLISPKEKWTEFAVKVHCDGQPREKILKITNIGHATLLIQCDSINLITDPLFSDHAGPFGKIGPKRVKEPGIPIEMLPHIDVVFISHNHYDHLDAFSVKVLDQNFRPTFIVPLGVKQQLEKWNVKGTIIELDWWQTHKIQTLTLTSVPAQHWSRRGFFDTNKTLWMGGVFSFDQQETIYFAGDTGYGEHFQDISKKFPSIHVALLPIGSYKPIEIMKAQHMGPKDAVQASKEMSIGMMIPIHFDVFALGSEMFEEAKNELLHIAEKENVYVNCIEVGESYKK